MKLSRPQIDALRYASGRQLYADAINSGNGNLRRTLSWLINHGLLGWDPTYQGRVVVTAEGEQALKDAERTPVVADYLRAKRRAETARTAKLGAKWRAEAGRIWRVMNAHARRAAQKEQTP